MENHDRAATDPSAPGDRRRQATGDATADVPVPRHSEDERQVSGFALEMLLDQLTSEVEKAGDTGDPGTRHDAAVLLAEARDGLRELLTR